MYRSICTCSLLAVSLEDQQLNSRKTSSTPLSAQAPSDSRSTDLYYFIVFSIRQDDGDEPLQRQSV